MLKGDFTENMGRVFIIYTGGCLSAAAVLVLMSVLGVSDHLIGIGFVALTVVFYALMGLLARTRHAGEYYEAGRRVPALYTGMATAADWMSAASFIGMAGAIYAAGYDGLAFVLGWTGGYILVAVLLAPYLRKFGQFTVPDFLAARYGGKPARLMGIVVLVSASFAYVVGQIYGTGIICARFLDIPFEMAVFVGLGGILLCSMLGGMRALIWTQVAQYVVVIAAYLLPMVLLSTRETGIPVPQIMYGEAMQRVAGLQAQLGLAPDALGISDRVNFFGLVLCLMLGTASLPHVLSRFFNTPSVREARTSVAWSLLFICLLYVTAPAYAAFAKLEVFQHVIATGLSSGPDWLEAWSRIGLMSLKDGVFTIDPDAVVLAAPEIAGLPFVVAGLVAAGALAASMSSADGLLLSIGNALSHDVYYRILKPTAETRHRLILGRVIMVLAALAAAWVASQRPAGILTVVGWAFSLAASGLFAALVLGIWWKRATKTGAVLGMASGWAVCLFYIVATQKLGMPPWFGVKNIAAGLFGLPVSLVVTVLASLFTKPPSQEMQDFIDSIRIPRGQVKMAPKAE
ncbi:MAG TPA: sodium:solute symporter family protein [Candidatus Sulfotelmatobacter sp.]|jgi:cation/acetate symporter|nr:sodium:solute symporter family protein [Candidatus Sulfotelmatobacter sp.]